MHKSLASRLHYLIATPFLLSAIVLFSNGAMNMYEHARVSRWEKTSGHLLDVRAGKSVPAVRYSYYVRGVRYENNVLSRLRISGGSVWAKDQLVELQRQNDTNAGLDVLYDPSNPSKSGIYNSAYATLEYFIYSCVALVIGAVVIKCEESRRNTCNESKGH